MPLMLDDLLFKECIDALGANVVILPKQESDMIWGLFKTTIPIIKGGSRVYWNKINQKTFINELGEMIPNLEKLLQQPIDSSIYLLWNDASLPVVKTTIEATISVFDDVTAVGFETWFFNPYQGYIIEFYYLGEMTAGLICKQEA